MLPVLTSSPMKQTLSGPSLFAAMTHNRSSSKSTQTIWDFKVRCHNFTNIQSKTKLHSLFEKIQAISEIVTSQDDNCKLIIFLGAWYDYAQCYTHTSALRPHLVDHTAPPEAHSFPWSCSGGRVPFHYASGLQKTGVEIRRNPVAQGVQGTHKGSSEGSVCTLMRNGRSSDTQLFNHWTSKHQVLLHMSTEYFFSTCNKSGCCSFCHWYFYIILYIYIYSCILLPGGFWGRKDCVCVFYCDVTHSTFTLGVSSWNCLSLSLGENFVKEVLRMWCTFLQWCWA